MRIPAISHLLERLEYRNPHARHADDTLTFGIAARCACHGATLPETENKHRVALSPCASWQE